MIKLICIVMAAVVCLSMVACGSQPQPGKKLVLSEVTHSIFYAPQYVAINKGYFKEEGLDIESITVMIQKEVAERKN